VIAGTDQISTVGLRREKATGGVVLASPSFHVGTDQISTVGLRLRRPGRCCQCSLLHHVGTDQISTVGLRLLDGSTTNWTTLQVGTDQISTVGLRHGVTGTEGHCHHEIVGTDQISTVGLRPMRVFSPSRRVKMT